MILIIIVLFIALLWALREIFVGFWVWKTRRSYRQIYRVEVTQRLFGEAREALIDFVKNGAIEDKSATFHVLYFTDSFVLRRPEAYSQISHILQQTLLNRTERSDKFNLQAESKKWSPEVRQLVAKHAVAIDNLVISHSRILRYLRKFANLVFKMTPQSRFVKSAYEATKRVVFRKEDSATHDLRASREQLLSLAGYPHNSLLPN